MHSHTTTTRLLISFTFLLAACGGGSSEPPPEDAAALFHFKMHDGLPDEDFKAYISDPAVKAIARAELRLPESQRGFHAVGRVARTNGGYNFNWSWHFKDPISLSTFSVELCDTTPTLIEGFVDFWIAAPEGACPWSSYVYAEIK